MDFSSDANANFEGLLEVNREICMLQMAEKTSPDVPPNCAVVPQTGGCPLTIAQTLRRQPLTP